MESDKFLERIFGKNPGPPAGIAVAHAAEAETGDGQAGFAKGGVLHGEPLWVWGAGPGSVESTVAGPPAPFVTVRAVGTRVFPVL